MSVTLVRPAMAAMTATTTTTTSLSLRLSPSPEPAQSEADDGIPTPEPLGSSRVLVKEKWWRSPEVTLSRAGNRLPSPPPFKPALVSLSPSLPPPPPPPPPPAQPRASKFEVAVFLLCVLAVGATGNTVRGFSFSPLSLRVAVLSALCAVLSVALLVLCIQFLLALCRPPPPTPPIESPASYDEL